MEETLNLKYVFTIHIYVQLILDWGKEEGADNEKFPEAKILLTLGHASKAASIAVSRLGAAPSIPMRDEVIKSY